MYLVFRKLLFLAIKLETFFNVERGWVSFSDIFCNKFKQYCWPLKRTGNVKKIENRLYMEGAVHVANYFFYIYTYNPKIR